MMHDWNSMGWGWGGMWFGPFYMIALFVLSVAVIVLLVRWLTNDGDAPRRNTQTSRQILDERFAKGEIDQDEYDSRRKSLGV